MGTANRVVLLFQTRFWPEHAHWMGIDAAPKELRGRFCSWINLQPHSPGKRSALLSAMATAGFAEAMEHMSDRDIVDAALSTLSKASFVFPICALPYCNSCFLWTDDGDDRTATVEVQHHSMAQRSVRPRQLFVCRGRLDGSRL
jgi:hypothetical protein